MKKIGKYEIIEKLGKGGMGEVYKAHDPLLQRDVAIKIISEKAFDRPEIKERFFREARAAAQLLHENITVVYDLGEENGNPYIVMEYLTGTDLRSIIKGIQTGRGEPLSLYQKLDYARQICRGFEFLHAKDIIHRDLKPENIRILDDGKAKIMDFGIAKSLSMASTMTQAGMIMGTPGYMSPEQIKGQKVDKRSDIFSFGVLFHELVTYKMPFKGQEVTSIWYSIVHEPPEQIDDLEIENLSPVRDIILKTLKKAPNERYQSFSDLLNDLETIIKHKETELKRLAEERRKKVEKLLAESDNFLKKKNFARALEKAEAAGEIATDKRSARELIALIKEEEEKENRRRLLEEKIRAAQKLMREEQYQQAMEFLNEALRIWPEHAEALKLRQEAQDGIRLEGERQRLERILAQGREYFQQNDFANAERLAVEGLKLNPQSNAALYLLEAVKTKKEEEEKKRQRIKERLQNVRQWLQERQYEKAIAAAELVLQDAPNQADAVKLIEEAKTGISRREEQKRIDNLLAAGKETLERGDLDGAQKIVEEILQLRPQEAKALNLVDAIAKRKEEEEKKKRLAAERLAMARELAAEEKYHKAIGVLKEVLLLAPDDAEAKSLLQHLIDETNAQIAAITETKFVQAPQPEAGSRRSEVDETMLVESEPEPATKRPSRATGRRPAEKAPFKFTRAHFIAAAVVVLVGAGVIYRLFLYTPPLPIGYVALNILPWAEVTKIENEAGVEVTERYAANEKMITPYRLALPEGKYVIHLTNPAFKIPLKFSVEVKKGELQEVKQKMPGFDYRLLLPQF
ncbi:protein kinase [candidate division KSB1 bacterium]|nr:protein kinase [candidate division KSB1 bacterium]